MIIRDPTIHLIGRQEIDDPALADFLTANDVSQWETDTTIGGEKLVEIAGRLCYQSYARPRPGGNKTYIRHLLEVAHGSCLEHAVFSLIFSGVSRSFTHELVRHRVGFAYSQRSQRYVNEDECDFVMPPTIQGDPELEALWTAAVLSSRAAYERLSDTLMDRLRPIPDPTARRKLAREAARSVLPNATATKIFVTANARALRHFVELRSAPGADAEMRTVALAALRILQDASPNLFGDYTVETASDGTLMAATPFVKV